MSTRPLLVSLVIPVLNEAENVTSLAGRVAEIEAANPQYAFEVVLVDDGSTDGTSDLVRQHLPPTSPWVIVELSRNFGSHYAVSAGFKYAKGDCAIVLGGDLQEPVSLVTDFLTQWRAGHDIVWGIRETRAKVSPLTSMFSIGFSKLFTRFAEIKTYPVEGPSGVLCDRRVLDVVTEFPERNRNFYGLIAWSGFSQTRVNYEQLDRQAGTSKWTRGKLLKLAIDSFVQFSSFPVRAMTWTGIWVAAIGFLYAAVLAVRAMSGTHAPTGWTTVIVVVLVLGGIQLVMMGVLGAYQWRTLDEVRQRPLFIVDSAEESAARAEAKPRA